MTAVEATPRSLRLVARIFLVFGLLAVVETLVRLAVGNIYITAGLLGIPIHAGLMHRRQGWRQVALLVLWWGFLTLPVMAVTGLIATGPVYFDLFGIQVATIPGWVFAAGCVPYFLLNLWQHRVLMKPEMRSLFGQRPSAAAA